MKIVNLTGGLGNQMFQYAFAEALSSHFPQEDILVDLQHFNWLFLKKYKTANLHNGCEIFSLFSNAGLRKASPGQLMRVSYYIPNFVLSRLARRVFPKRKTEFIQNKEDHFTYDPTVFEIKTDCYYEGYWEAIDYYLPIRDKLLSIFRHGEPNEYNKMLIDRIESENSVGIHIRRGDYLKTASFSGICDVEYYKNAINYLLDDGKPHSFFIFSNDIEWCKSNISSLVGGNPLFFITDNTGKNSCWDMFLMTHCKHLIIANSSFSWWGAFLNERGGHILAPQKWINQDKRIELFHPSWTLI